jgi:putative hemolysin
MILVLTLMALAASSFFSASETALFSIPRERIFFFQKNPDKSYLRIYSLLKNGQKTLLMILLGNIFVNITLTGLIHALLRIYLALDSEIITLVVATSIIVLFGEILPKNIALRYNEGTARVISFPLLSLVNVFSPVLVIIQGVNRFFINHFRMYFRDPGPFVTVNELKTAVDTSMKEGAISADESAVVHRILDQGADPARRYMIHRSKVLFLNESTDVKTACLRMKQKPCSIALLKNDDMAQISGIVHLAAIFSESDNLPVLQFAQSPVWVPDSSEVAELIGYLYETRRPGACLIDEYGGFSGYFSVDTAVKTLFSDLFQKSETIQTKSIGSTLKGTMDYKVLGRYLPQTFIHEYSDSRTVNGVLTNYLGRIPKTGEMFALFDCKFYIVSASPTKIEQVLIQKGESNDS